MIEVGIGLAAFAGTAPPLYAPLPMRRKALTRFRLFLDHGGSHL